MTEFTKWKDTSEYYIAYSIMINAAQHQGLATYQEIAQACGLPTSGSYMGGEIGDLIGDVSRNEISLGRPMLSAVVVGVSGKPGPGFQTWAKELGAMQEDEDWEEFWRSECQKIYDTWKPTYRISHSK
jgi:hypothetical protein